MSPAPGKVEDAYCGICGYKMLVSRNVYGYASLIAAMGSKTKTLHDSFICPHYHEDWHKLMLELIFEQNRTRSKSIKAIIQKDIDDILRTSLTN